MTGAGRTAPAIPEDVLGPGAGCHPDGCTPAKAPQGQPMARRFPSDRRGKHPPAPECLRGLRLPAPPDGVRPAKPSTTGCPRIQSNPPGHAGHQPSCGARDPRRMSSGQAASGRAVASPGLGRPGHLPARDGPFIHPERPPVAESLPGYAHAATGRRTSAARRLSTA